MKRKFINGLSAFLLTMVFNGSATAEIIKLVGTDFDLYYDNAQPGIGYHLFHSIQTSATSNSIVISSDLNARSTDGIGLHTGTSLDSREAVLRFSIVLKGKARLQNIAMKRSGNYQRYNSDLNQVNTDATLMVASTSSSPSGIIGPVTSQTEGLSDGKGTSPDLDLEGFHPWIGFTNLQLDPLTWTSVKAFDVVLMSRFTASSSIVPSLATIGEANIGLMIYTIK